MYTSLLKSALEAFETTDSWSKIDEDYCEWFNKKFPYSNATPLDMAKLRAFTDYLPYGVIAYVKKWNFTI